MDNCVVILAGGQGRRMKSSSPKVLFKVLGVPMIDWVTQACEDSGLNEICIVKGFGAEALDKHLNGRYETALQEQILGTGHAVMQAKDFLKKHINSNVLILNGDAPFIDKNTILDALDLHVMQGNSATVVTSEVENPYGYGRIIRENGILKGIVEQKDCTANESTIHEINCGAYWFKVEDLLAALDKIVPENSQNKYYLTDCVEILVNMNKRVGAYITDNSNAALGAWDRRGLLALNDIARTEVIFRHLENGVEFTCAEGVVISPTVKIGADTVIESNVTISGSTVIGKGSFISEGCRLVDTVVGDNVELYSVFSKEAVVDDGAKIGPWVQLRPNSHIKKNVKIGDFVEIKNSEIGEGTAVAHLTYIGDSTVGKNVNFGCGVVTVNYNGEKKCRTTIGDNAFIGCNTNLIAPVTVGECGYTGAGSTITRDVAAGDLVVERADPKTTKGYGYKKLRNRVKKAAMLYDSATDDDVKKSK